MITHTPQEITPAEAISCDHVSYRYMYMYNIANNDTLTCTNNPAVHSPPHVGSPVVNLLGLLEQCLELILGLHQLVPQKPVILLLTLLLLNRQTKSM